MRLTLLAGCAAVLMIHAGAAMAQTTTTPAEPQTREAPAQDTPPQAAPAESAPSQAAPPLSAPAESAPAQEAQPSEPPTAAPSASESASPSARESEPPAASEVAPRARRPLRAPAVEAPGSAGRAVNKRRACRIEARRLGLRGAEASGHAMICLAEARLACTKEAVARSSDRRDRVAYIRDCMGQGQRRPR